MSYEVMSITYTAEKNMRLLFILSKFLKFCTTLHSEPGASVYCRVQFYIWFGNF